MSAQPWWRLSWRLGSRSRFDHDFQAPDESEAVARAERIEREWQGPDRLRGGRLARLVRR